MSVAKDLPRRLRTLIKKHQVPGASVGILRNGKVIATAAAGVTNVDTAVPATVDTVFQIGSITKVFTTSLIMQLVDEGLLDLDDTVQKHLPDFRVADRTVSVNVTIRDLLCHRSGIDGDFFENSGRGDDATAKLIEKGTMLPSLFPIGERHSYCNFGFVVLGRIIEVTTGLTWDEAMMQNLFQPLGMEQAMTLPEDALRYRCAIGHVASRRKKGTWYASNIPYLSFGMKAAGATPAMSVPDLLKFAGMHLDKGRNEQGETILTGNSVRAMQKRQIAVQRNSNYAMRHWGLGWFLMDWHGNKLFGHDGATVGQFAFLRILPSKNMAVALLTNGGDAQSLARDIWQETFLPLAKVNEPPAPEINENLKYNADEYVGDYANIAATITLKKSGNRLRLSSTPNGMDEGAGLESGWLQPIDRNTFQLQHKDPMLARLRYLFSRNSDGTVTHVANGMRQFRRL